MKHIGNLLATAGCGVGLAVLGGLVGLSGSTTPAQAEENWWPYKVEVWSPACTSGNPACWDLPENGIGKREIADYVPLNKASKKWHVCVSFPHLKDSYWLGADYGIIQEGRRLGIKVTVVEAGGYVNLPTQISQIENCVSSGADAMIIAAISAEGTAKIVDEVRSKGIPVIDLVNGINTEVDAKALIRYGNIGYEACKFIADKHPAGSGKVKMAWFPGPPGAGWSTDADKQCKQAVKGSDVEIVATKWGDTGKEVQLKLVEDVVEAQTSGGKTDLNYIVGTSVTAEAAAGTVRDRGLVKDVGVMAYYYSPGVHRLLAQKRLLAAPTDQQAMQARIAIDQAVRLLEKKPMATGGRDEHGSDKKKEHVGPQIIMVTPESFASFDPSTTNAPDGWKPVFEVD